MSTGTDGTLELTNFDWNRVFLLAVRGKMLERLKLW